MRPLFRRFLPSFFTCMFAAALPAQDAAAPAAPPPPEGMELVWSDEFAADGRPDPRNWTYEIGYVRNREAQWYRSENAEVKNGCLVSVENPFRQPHYLLVNLALGGICGGDVTAIKFPIRMYVDYVRVYQKKK